MSINELKNMIHTLVEKSDNKYLLELIYSLFSIPSQEKNIWEALTENQKELVIKSFNQSELDENLIYHDNVMAKIINEI